MASRRSRVSFGSPLETSIGFSRAIRVGNRVIVSGTAPVYPDGSCPDDPGAQARRCLEIISKALLEAGSDIAHVVCTRMFITSAAHAESVGSAHAEVFGDVRPAATMVVVAGLLDPRWKVEIEAEAVDEDTPLEVSTIFDFAADAARSMSEKLSRAGSGQRSDTSES
jgi:enamine deaminase RidA (YjgF/YER057c/UK114 family)